jgi:Lrp/AsnC family transcriptional regulator of ectoine degradation
MSRPLDDRDLQILTVLSREGRITKAELARRINLSATPAWERLKRLEAEGYIEGYRAEVALARIGPHVAVFVTVELDNHRAETFQSFERAIARHDEIQAAWAIGGGFDYLLKIVSRDIDSYQRLIDALLAERTGMRRYFTYVVTKDVKTSTAPPFDALIAPAEAEI